MVSVEQCDREAVWRFHSEMAERLLSDIRHGTDLLDAKGEDIDPIYQAFARHRIAAIEATGVVELRRENTALRLAMHEIDIEAANTIPPDGKAAAFATLERITRLINPFRLTQLAKGSE